MDKLKSSGSRVMPWIHVYMAITVLGLILPFLPFDVFDVFPAPIRGLEMYVVGFITIWNIFILIFGTSSPIIIALLLTLGLGLIISLIVCYMIAVIKRRYFPFIVTMGVNLASVLVIVGFRIAWQVFEDLQIFIIPFIFRAAYFAWMLHCYKKAKTNMQ